MDFVAFDLETTGTEPEADSIVEIGAVKFVDFKPVDSYATLIDPERFIPEEATRVNGITNDMVKGKPPVQDVLAPFADFCEELPIVAHNARFDFLFLSASIKRFEARAPRGIVLDTHGLAKRIITGAPNHRLETLVRFLEIPASTFHRAEEDAAHCGMLFIRILEMLRSSNQPTGIGDLLSLSGKQEMYFPQLKKGDEQLALF